MDSTKAYPFLPKFTQLLLDNLFDIQGNIQNAKTYYRN